MFSLVMKIGSIVVPAAGGADSISLRFPPRPAPRGRGFRSVRASFRSVSEIAGANGSRAKRAARPAEISPIDQSCSDPETCDLLYVLDLIYTLIAGFRYWGDIRYSGLYT